MRLLLWPLAALAACGGGDATPCATCWLEEYDHLIYAEEFEAGFPAALSRIQGPGFPETWDGSELEIYQPAHVSVTQVDGNGMLDLHGTWSHTGEYLSGEVVSSPSHCPRQLEYGPGECAQSIWGSGVRFATSPTQGLYLEIRAKAPLLGGQWPALWLLSDEGVDPPELDILEVFANGDHPHPFCQTEIWGTAAQTQASQSCRELDAQQFHAFGVIVDPAAGRVAFRADGDAWAVPDHSADWADSAKNGVPIYFLINLALTTMVEGPFPTPDGDSHLYVDYVRAYTNGPNDLTH